MGKMKDIATDIHCLIGEGMPLDVVVDTIVSLHKVPSLTVMEYIQDNGLIPEVPNPHVRGVLEFDDDIPF